MLLICSILILLVFSSAWAEKICLRQIDGEMVYTNLCGKESKKLSTKKISFEIDFSKKEAVKYSKNELEKIVEEKSNLYGVDSKLIKEIIKEESNWNINAVSPKGAMGIMQLMPSTALLLGVKNPFDPVENIDGGIRYMKYLLDKFNGNINLALAAYNAGPNLVESLGRIPNIQETLNYVRRISLRYNGFLPAQSETAKIRKSLPIKVIILSDGTVIYTNREDIYTWSTKQ